MTLLMIAIVGVSITSCKGDDGEQTTGTSQNQSNAGSLVGTWEYSDGEGREVMTIKEDGTLTVTATIYDEGESYSGTGKWFYKDGYLSIEPNEDETMVIPVLSVSSTELVLKDYPNNGNCVWKRK